MPKADSRPPFFRSPGFERPIVLYDGPARLHSGADVIDGVGQVTFHWRRSPRIIWSLLSNDDGAHDHFFDLTPATEQRIELLDASRGIDPRSDVDPWPKGLRAGYSYRTGGYQDPKTIVGEASGFSSAQVHIVNFVDQLPTTTPSVAAEFASWQLTVVRSDDTADVEDVPSSVELRWRPR